MFSLTVGNDPRAARRFVVSKQSKDYDSHGEFVKLWIPALRNLHPDDVHTPWLLSEEERRNYGIKSTVMDVGIDSYPASPMFEDESWHKHYGRKEGVGSKMFGNPQERIKDAKAKRGGKRPLVPRGLPQPPAFPAAPPLKLVSGEKGAAGPQPVAYYSGYGVPGPPTAQRSSSFGAPGVRPGLGSRAASLPRPPTGLPRHIAGPPFAGGPVPRAPGPLPSYPPAPQRTAGFARGPSSTPSGMPGYALPPLPSQYARQPQQKQHTSRSFSESNDEAKDDQLSWRRGGSKPPSSGV